MLLKIFVSSLWILFIYLALAHDKLRRKVQKLKQRVDKLEHPSSDGGEADWAFRDSNGDDE